MLAAAWAGAGLFAASLAYFAYFYLIVLGRPSAAPVADMPGAAAFNVALFSAFALHHSICARTGTKAAIARTVPAAFERSLYVWLASALFLGVCLLWRPLPGMAWQASGAAAWALHGVQLAGGLLTLASAARIDVWDLAGVRQVWRGARSSSPSSSASSAAPALEVSGPYRWLRHPIYLGWVLVVFAAPTMTGGRLLFSIISTLYIALAIPFEEHGLVAEFGQPYRDYQRRVRWRLLPGIW